jgi:hypothetical protein
MASGMSDMWSESTRWISILSRTLLIPSVDALSRDNLVVALVTGPIEDAITYLSLFVGSLCNGGLFSLCLISILASSE